MGYVPPNGGVPKVGRLVKTENDGTNKYEYVEIDVTPNVYTWKNVYSKNVNKNGTSYTFSGTYLVSTVPMSQVQIKAGQDAEYKKNEDALNGFTSLAGINLYPPEGLSKKELARWYEVHILGVIQKLQDIAVKLGKDPNEVGKALTEATKLLSTATATALASVTAGTALAGFLAVGGPITAGIAVIIGVLDAFGVFKNDDATIQNQLGFEYKGLTFFLQKWYGQYAIALSQVNQVDQIEFTKELQLKYGVNFGTDTGNSELNKQIPSGVTASTDSTNTLLYVGGVGLLLLFLWFLTSSRNV